MLFRSEAARGRHRLQGEVSLAPPVRWQVLGLCLAGVLVVAAAFLSIATYSRRVIAEGTIEGDRGVVRILAPRRGMLSRVYVREGELVRAGQRLARLTFATAADDGTLEERRAAAIAAERRAADARTPAEVDASQARIAALDAERDGAREERGEIGAQMTEQAALIRSAGEDVERTRSMADLGYVSRNDVRVREEALTGRRQALMRLRADDARLAAQIARADADIAREHAVLAIARADAGRIRGQLAATAAADDVQRWMEVTAPVDGRVTGMMRTSGAGTAPGEALLSLVPAGTRLVARLAVPAAGVGFVRPGQTIAIALDAFPREVFGTMPARIAYVTAASIPGAARRGAAFVAEAPLDRMAIAAYGTRYPLRPGMTLSATITTRRLSLIRWLLDPLFAVMRR